MTEKANQNSSYKSLAVNLLHIKDSGDAEDFSLYQDYTRRTFANFSAVKLHEAETSALFRKAQIRLKQVNLGQAMSFSCKHSQEILWRTAPHN